MSTVHVTFLDAGNGETITDTELAADELPESFSMETVLELDEKDWVVLSAEPSTVAEAESTGSLTLEVMCLGALREAAEGIRYARPTICIGPPKNEDFRVDDDHLVLELQEDDWRQVELVRVGAREQVEAVMSAIVEVYENHSQEDGFDALYVREAPRDPLEGVTLSFEALMELAPDSDLAVGVRWLGDRRVLLNSFAFAADGGLVIYGERDGSKLISAGIAVVDAGEGEPPLDVEAVARLLQVHNVMIVDWVSCAAFDGSDLPALQEYMGVTPEGE